jgi:hypothetical protein
VTLYPVLLVVHSYVRWTVVAALAAVVARGLHGWSTGRPWTRADERTHVALVALVDLQLLLGAWLYLHASPFVRVFLSDPVSAMRVGELRFFGLEHPVLMLTAFVVIHVGRWRAKSKDRHRRAATWTLAAVLLVVAGIPWPRLPHGRPLLRPVDIASAGPVPSQACMR